MISGGGVHSALPPARCVIAMTEPAAPPCAHSHAFHSSAPQAEQRAWHVVWLTAVMMLVEILAGWWSGSMALLADGWHMASHVVAIGLAALAYRHARRHAGDHRYAFGTWKIEVLGGFASAVLLAAVAVLMAFESLLRLANPVDIAFGEAMGVAAIGLLVNLASAWLLHDDGHEHGTHAHEAAHAHGHGHGHGHDAAGCPEAGQPHAHGHDLNHRAAYLHVLADALTSVAAILALAGGEWFGWNWLDPMTGLAGSLIIGVWARGLLIETGRVLLDREMDDPLVGRVRAALEDDSGTRVEDLHLWRIGRRQYACIVAVSDALRLAPATYKARLAGFPQIVHVTVEVNERGLS